mgnify:FL=1|jgi:hypothetical protein
MEEKPNPTWLARLIFVLGILTTVIFFGILAIGLLTGQIRKQDLERTGSYLGILGLPGAIACFSWATYYVIIGNIRPQDESILTKVKRIYMSYFGLTLLTMAAGYVFFARS